MQGTDMQRMTLRESALSIQGGIAEFTLQRPKARNALSQAITDDLAEALGLVAHARDVRVLIITGSGGSFCAGGDIKAMRERHASTDPEHRAPEFMRRRLDNVQQTLIRLRELDIPVIAAVDGPAYGAGFGLALQADFVIASTSASFCMSFARIGAIPDFGALNTLPRIVGLARAKEIMLTARKIDAREGLELGFVHSLHAPEMLLGQARAFAARLARGPREAAGLTKRLLNRTFETDYATLAALEACAQAVCLGGTYHLEAAARFAAGMPAEFDWERLA